MMRNYILSTLCLLLTLALGVGLEAAYPSWWWRVCFVVIVAYVIDPFVKLVFHALERRRRKVKRRSAFYALIEVGGAKKATH